MPALTLRICHHHGIERIRRTIKLLGAFLVVLGVLPAAAAASDTLATYGTLSAGQAIVSTDGHYELVMLSNGNLVEAIVGGRTLWQSHTTSDDGAHAVMQAGGNLVIYNPAGAAVWSSNSSSTGCPELTVQDDGNVVIYSPKAIWATHTVQTTMQPGDVLKPGWSIYSPSEHLQLIMQVDGNLVLYDGAGKALWASGTHGHPGAYAIMQTDGNLVVYPPTGHALWASGTYKDHGSSLSLQSDGNLVIYDGTKAVWSTKTNGKESGGSRAPAHPAPLTSCPAPALPPPPTPVMTAPVTTPIEQPPAPHALAVKMQISWTWDHAVTKVHGTKIGRFPGKSQIFVQCRGRGCPGKRDISARGFRPVLHLLHNLRGRRFRAGDRVLIILKAPGYLPERAMVQIRNGRLRSRCSRIEDAEVRTRWLLAVAAGACGLLLATALAASAQTNVTVSPRDDCGGFNGHVVWTEGSGAYIQLYGEVWDTNCPGSTSVWLAWDSPSYHNVNAETANEPNTEGVNYKTGISADPTDIKVTVCSTNGGWHCGTPVDVATSPPPTTTPPPTTPPPTTSPPTSPVVTTPTSTSLPTPTVAHALAVRLSISWTWNHATTRWHAAKIGRFPGRAQIFVQCRGRGCAGKRNLSAHGARNVRRLLRRLRGRRFRAGDRVLIVLKAPGYLPERALVRILDGRLPQITLLPN